MTQRSLWEFVRATAAVVFCLVMVTATTTVAQGQAAPASGTTCNGAFGGVFNGNITVMSGQACIFTGGSISGNVFVGPGATLTLTSVRVGGSLTYFGLASAGGTLALTDVQVGGNTTIDYGGTGGSGVFPVAMTEVQVGGNATIGLNNAGGMVNGNCPLIMDLVNVNGDLTIIGGFQIGTPGGDPDPLMLSGNLSHNVTLENLSFPVAINSPVGGNLTLENLASFVTINDAVSGNLESGSLTVNGGALTLNGSVNGNVTVSGGGLQLNGNVGGNVTISGVPLFSNSFVTEGSLFGAQSVRIGGNLTVQRLGTATAGSAMCGTTITGNMTWSSNATAIQMGSASGSCPGNTIGANLEIVSNTAAVQIFDNTMGRTLQCVGNSNISGGGNKAQQKLGQCTGF